MCSRNEPNFAEAPKHLILFAPLDKLEFCCHISRSAERLVGRSRTPVTDYIVRRCDNTEICRTGARPCVLPVDAAHAEIFDLEEFLDAVFRAFAADAALLHAAKGRDLGRDDASAFSTAFMSISGPTTASGSKPSATLHSPRRSKPGSW